jgi:hypothetical protein
MDTSQVGLNNSLILKQNTDCVCVGEGRAFGANRKEITGGLSKLCNEEFHNLNYSSNAITVLKQRIMKWAVHITHLYTTKSMELSS